MNDTSEDNVEITLDNNLKNIEEKMRADGLGEEEIKIMRMMQEELSKEEMQQPMSLRFIDRKKLKEKTLQVDKIIPYLGTNNLFQCNKILKAAGFVVERLVGVKKKRITRGKTEPWWKKRLINQINELRKEIGKLESCKNNTMKNEELKALIQPACFAGAISWLAFVVAIFMDHENSDYKSQPRGDACKVCWLNKSL